MPWYRTIGPGDPTTGLAGANAVTNAVLQGNTAMQAANIGRWNEAQRYFDAMAERGEATDYARMEAERLARERAQREARHEFEWGVNRQDLAKQQDLYAKLERERMATTSADRALRVDPTLERRAQFEESRLAQAAAEAAIDNPEHALTIAPTVGPDIAKFYADESARARTEIEAQDKQAESAAATLNAYAKLKAERTALDTEVKSAWFGRGNEARNARIAELDSKIGSMADIVAQYKKAIANPRHWLSESLVAGENGTYHTSLPPRKWQARSTAPPTAAWPRMETSPRQSIRIAFPTIDDVRAAVQSGQLPDAQALDILTTAF